MTGDFYECPKCGWRARLSDVDIRTRCSCGRMVQLPAATAPNPRAWRVAIALALALPEPPDWALWAIGETAAIPDAPGPDCDECGGWGGYRDTLADECSDQWYTCSRGCESPKQRARKPVPAPWDAAAYLADCVRRGVEPGPMPSLSWTGDGISWEVRPAATELEVVIQCGRARLSWWTDGSTIVTSLGCMNLDDLARAVTLATAAKRAMGGP